MFEKIQAYLANQLDISPDDITPETTFESLGIDSLDTVEMVIDLEEQLGVDLELEEKLATVGELVDFVESKLDWADCKTGDPVRSQAALLGEIAVPCYPQSATAGRNSQRRVRIVSSDPYKRR